MAKKAKRAKPKQAAKAKGSKDHLFKPGNNANPAGRPVGSVQKITSDLKRGIIQAAINRGRDGRGTGGLVGFLEWLARVEPKSFASLLGRVVPLHLAELEDKGDVTLTKAEVLEHLKSRGLTFLPVFALPAGMQLQAQQQAKEPKIIEGELLPPKPEVVVHTPEQVVPQTKFQGVAPPREEDAGKPKPKAAA